MQRDREEGAQRAVKGDAIGTLVRTLKLVQFACARPLMDIVSMDPDLEEQALAAGAKEEWFRYGEGHEAEAEAADDAE